MQHRETLAQLDLRLNGMNVRKAAGIRANLFHPSPSVEKNRSGLAVVVGHFAPSSRAKPKPGQNKSVVPESSQDESAHPLRAGNAVPAPAGGGDERRPIALAALVTSDKIKASNWTIALVRWIIKKFNHTNYMKQLKSILIVTALIASTLPLMAQRQRVSPHETTGAVIEGTRVTIVYGRPYTKDPKTGEVRKIWGGLVPYGKVWRTGADEATLLITQKPIQFGATPVPAGAYTLFTLPQADGTAKLIINKQVGQWGVGPGAYDETQDLARIDLKKDALDKTMDQLTLAISKDPAGGGVLKIMWEDTQFSVPFTAQK
jgi:hypothetical protein